MNEIKLYHGENIPLELHKVRVVQKLHLLPIERRLEALYEGDFNTFRLNTKDVFLDMLTDSGTTVREIEAMAVGLDETLDETMISQSPRFIAYLVSALDVHGVPMIKPAGVLGAHVDAMQVCDHIPQKLIAKFREDFGDSL